MTHSRSCIKTWLIHNNGWLIQLTMKLWLILTAIELIIYSTKLIIFFKGGWSIL